MPDRSLTMKKHGMEDTNPGPGKECRPLSATHKNELQQISSLQHHSHTLQAAITPCIPLFSRLKSAVFHARRTICSVFLLNLINSQNHYSVQACLHSIMKWTICTTAMSYAVWAWQHETTTTPSNTPWNRMSNLSIRCLFKNSSTWFIFHSVLDLLDLLSIR